MEKKIKQYVDYQFRFDQRDDIEELKAEIIANLIDRYHEYVNKGMDPEEAYIEAIKSMGDFSPDEVNEIPDEYSVKPSIPDILLMCGAILSVFGLLLTFFSVITGTLITALSIILFSGSAYYLYSYSQFVRKQYMDIEKHNALLKKIFKYMKTSFAFWALSLSYIMTTLVMNVITQIRVLKLNVSLNPEAMYNNFTSIASYIRAYMIIFLVILILFMILFGMIYKLLLRKYYLLTGDTKLKSKINDSAQFLLSKEHDFTIKNMILSRKFYPILGILMILPELFLSTTFWFRFSSFTGGSFVEASYVEDSYLLILFQSLFESYYMVVILPIIALVLNIVTITYVLICKKNYTSIIIGYYFWFVSTILMYVLIEIIPTKIILVDGLVGLYSLVMMIILTILLYVRMSIQNKDKQMKESSS